MRKTERFFLHGQYESLFRMHGIRVEDALGKAGLPVGFFSGQSRVMTADQYFDFIEAAVGLTSDPDFLIHIATSENIETFSPPIFAAYCSRDGNTCIRRIAEYKKLMGPVCFQVDEDFSGNFSVRFWKPDGEAVPGFLAVIEMVFLTHLLRSATGVPIVPQHVAVRREKDRSALEAYMKCRIDTGEEDVIVFSERDLRLPFTSYNESMWEYFEPELNRRRDELDADESFSAVVRSTLTELLPDGRGNVDGVALELGLSRRTLQRRLAEENTTFQEQLNHTRELLSKHYLASTEMPAESIAYLLGFKELNSFLRSFAVWTGVPAGEYRRQKYKAEK